MQRPLREISSLSGHQDVKCLIPFSGTVDTKSMCFHQDGQEIKGYLGEFVDEPFDLSLIPKSYQIEKPRLWRIKDPQHFLQWMNTTPCEYKYGEGLTHAEYCRKNGMCVTTAIVYGEHGKFQHEDAHSASRYDCDNMIPLVGLLEFPRSWAEECVLM